ncbi:coiled-coil domain-containing protein 73-like isoform X2 [Anguilla anguilla]|uniref:coiled-coil domain-containing protein 73-like isoform X2 n=1 Tax=Anguilla anguilla TaxID=7936 RepID=UPI0015A93181|nr:coiled-coil domain-containing protein 73-like isoform X2 [Anguilla anguilla]
MIDASDLPICFATLLKHNSRSHSSRMSGADEEIFQNFLLHFETAVETDLRRHFLDSLNGEQVFDHELSSLDTPLASDDGFLSIQVLEFKTSLLEAAEELHIHRDAEMGFEEQINKFVMEKQELEWEKESLQHQIDTLVHQHNESLAAQKKQFQAMIAEIEGEKGKHQLSAELKDRENVRLKEALKMLQLFKCSLQKKLSELEQKLLLQAQARDSHLSLLAEVERRFGALSRQCATIKQAHEKLVQNVEEALRLNKKLAIVNEQQQATINSLKQDVDKANSQVIKSKVSSACKSEEDISLHIMKEQMQLLSLRLNMETEMNKQLIKENVTVMVEKQDVMRALQQACQLLQAQTEALSRAERELSAQREERQGRKLLHEERISEPASVPAARLNQLFPFCICSKANLAFRCRRALRPSAFTFGGGPAGSYFPGPSAASVSTPPAGIAARRPSPPDHAAECTPPEPGSDGNEQSKISARIGDTGRLQLPQKRKAEPEDHEVYTSTKQHSSWASLWEV